MATFDSQTFNGRYIRLTVTESDVEPANNRSKVNWDVTVYGGNGTWYSATVYLSINGTDLVNTSWIDPPQGSFPMVNGTSKSGSMWVSHDSDGKKTVDITFNTAIYYKAAQEHGGTFELTEINREAPTITQQNISNIGTTSFKIGATSNVNCNIWEYTLNNGQSWTRFSTTNGKNAYHTVTNLTINTSYTVKIRAAATSNGVYGISGEKSATTLGASPITNVSNIYFGQSVKVVWTPFRSSFRFKLTFRIDDWTHTTDYIYPETTDEYEYTDYVVPSTIAEKVPNATTGVMSVTLTTYNGNTSLGMYSDSFVISVPSTVIPEINSVTLEEGTQSGFGVYTKTLSTVKATVDADGKYGSTIAGITVKINTQTYTANSSGVAVSDILQSSGVISVVTTVTDSRGRTATDIKNITVYDYYQPTGTIQITRYAVDAVPNIRITVTGSIAPVNNLNAKQVVITRKRLSDDTTETYPDPVVPVSNYNYTLVWDQSIADIETESYEYTVEITDSKQTVTIKQQTAVICISRLAGGRGVTLFEEASEEGFWVRDVDYTISDVEYRQLAVLIAVTYSTSLDYTVGDFVIYNSNIYECNTDCSAASWSTNQSKFTLLGSVS